MKNIFFLFVLVLAFSCKQEVKKEEQQITSTANPPSENKTPEPETEILKEEETYSHKNIIAENVMVPFEPRFFKETSDHRKLLGFYVGGFKAVKYDQNKKPSYSNLINISINHIKKDSIFGHSVVAGNARPFKGILDITTLKAKVTEPGDDKYDGVFEFTINPDGSRVRGIWIANNTKLAVTERKYRLTKTKFSYNPDQKLVDVNEEEYEELMDGAFTELYNKNDDSKYYDPDNPEDYNPESEYATLQSIKINASNTELTNADVENLYKGDLEIIRNAIYARHGYSFKNRRMRYFFDSNVDWYIPISTDVRTQLTDLEKKNIELLKRYEQHAEKYYDYFGR